ncbi:hypothetical protein HMPREF9141_1433 [Prevotella multiformis DSM 16608]|uniref:Uncharacterized protein n=1 Tax=Prevotella multiformis DSM 16608 TaxID=888743 RepID=F0F766_9BACT|nr:hypothetical protein HMPREF9141_1433 [Prevotella multiformis DSM 16608]
MYNKVKTAVDTLLEKTVHIGTECHDYQRAQYQQGEACLRQQPLSAGTAHFTVETFPCIQIA